MTAYRLTLKAPAEGPLAELLAAHPGLCVEGTPVGGLLLLRLEADADTIDQAEEYLETHIVLRHRGKEGDALTVVVEMPPPETRLLERLRAQDALLLPPLLWHEDAIQARFILFDELNGESVGRLLPGASLESKSVLRGSEVDRELLASGLLLPSLTRRQGEAILAAIDAGYYEAPRRVTTAEVAPRLGIARSTFEEHLKAAEAQLIGALAPVVRLRLLEREQGSEEAVGAEALRLYARFSEDLGLYVSMAVRGNKVAAVSLAERPPKEAYGSDHPYLAEVLEHLATGKGDLQDIPLDLHVTPFEREVLDTLRTIPPGKVITYGELAKKIGKPNASRAVGNVCAMNPAILVVPCHRVVPAAGGVGHYGGAGGPRTKRKLLEKEGALPEVAKGHDQAGLHTS